MIENEVENEDEEEEEEEEEEDEEDVEEEESASSFDEEEESASSIDAIGVLARQKFKTAQHEGVLARQKFKNAQHEAEESILRKIAGLRTCDLDEDLKKSLRERYIAELKEFRDL